ncbi:hypothetical protein J437_LFUL003151 [Ladona fulva]|uniref:MMS19 nucleotide excision repair protein n=1 Tax=Ladona fulva TaxID=123851 RepID=A0A8K0KSJ5_LADFU|nr:hypothetical protein J437_LFUL003151 [Ladona fulva]
MAAPSVDDKLHDVVKGDDNLISYCHELAADIEKRSLEFVNLVEKLGFALTDEDVALRERGTLVLSYVLQNIPEDFLQENELHFITSFFVDRLKDHHNVIPAVLKGILAIVSMKNLPEEAPSRILSTMFREISCQSQLQSDRRVIYRIIHTSIVNKLEEMKKMGPDLVAGVIQSIDGERDPRNLLFLFSILPTFIGNFELGHLTEEMFDVISCYFPVDFSPPANDPNSVTREDLAHLLAQSLVSTTAFAEFCLPLLMEKLDSNIRVAKLDALLVLREACKKFLLKDLEPHIRELWKCILKEIIPGTEKEIQDAAIATLKELIYKLSVEITNKEQSKLLPDLLTQVIGASQSLLTEVDSSLFVAVIKLLTASAEASPFACHYIVSRVQKP